MAERAAVLITSNLPFDEWTEIFGSERLTKALPDRLAHHVHILEMNGKSFRLSHGRAEITRHFTLTELRHSRASGNPHVEGAHRLMRSCRDKFVELGRAPIRWSCAALTLPGSSTRTPSD